MIFIYTSICIFMAYPFYIISRSLFSSPSTRSHISDAVFSSSSSLFTFTDNHQAEIYDIPFVSRSISESLGAIGEKERNARASQCNHESCVHISSTLFCHM